MLGLFQVALGQEKFSVGPITGFNIAKLSTESENVSGTARPFLGLFGQYRPIKLLSAEMNAAYSMRGERFDKMTLRFEANFIDAHFLLRIHFLKDFSFGTGIGYYYALNARTVNRLTTDNLFRQDLEDIEQLSQMVVPLELGFQFHNEATLHFAYGYAFNGGFNNPAVTFRFPIGVTPKENRSISRRVAAKQQIRALDDGMLLVRLRTAQPLIDRLKNYGAPDKTEEVIKKVDEENLDIVDAFESHYVFSKVYYFYSTFSTEVKNGDLSSVMNADLEIVSFSQSDTADYYIAEFANLKPDTGRYYIDSSIEPDPNGGLRRVKRYGDYDIGANIQALVIKDKNYIQLRDPFPYYKRSILNSLSPTREALQRPIPIIAKDKHKQRYRHAVQRMNNTMERFRKRARTEEEKEADKKRKKDEKARQKMQ